MALEAVADQFFEYLAAAAGGDVKQGKQRRGDAPDPVLLAVVLQARSRRYPARLVAGTRRRDFVDAHRASEAEIAPVHNFDR